VIFSPHTLHAAVPLSDEHRAAVIQKFVLIAEARKAQGEPAPAPAPAPAGDSVSIDLTTVSQAGNFDAYVGIRFNGDDTGSLTSLIVDSGNSTLIVPYWEHIQDLPGYTVLGAGREPWGSPANIVKGPILLPTSDGGVYTIPDCVFYACTGGSRTANFGAGRPTPWSANGWNTPSGVPGLVMQAPLSYNTDYPYAEFSYASAEEIFGADGAPTVVSNSFLVLYRSQPSGYTVLQTLQNLEWMAVIPQSLSIEGTGTPWPGSVSAPIAMVDTGGGPVFLSDPDGYVYQTTWGDPAACPGWTSTSLNCQCISGQIGLQLGDGTTSVSYTIDPALLPAPAKGLTAVLCQTNAFMMGRQGMNIGGISALFNDILVDYAGSQVGFRAKAPT
jgi:hypothetical protein